MAYEALLAERRYPLSAAAYATHWPSHSQTHSTYLPSQTDSAAPGTSFSGYLTGTFSSSSSAAAWALDDAAAYAEPAAPPSPFSAPSADYPESTQRTALPLDRDLPRSPTHSPHQPWGDDLYLAESPSSRQPSSAPDDDPNDEPEGCFIMELSSLQTQPSTLLSHSLAPPTEVPLRATQASKEMRKMMGVFRLNPFAMHNGETRGVLASSWCGGDARPLDEEPIVFEFQLDLDDAVSDDDDDQLRAFSPDFELHHNGLRDQDEGDRSTTSDWGEYARSESAFTPTPPGASWELDYPASEEHLSSSESTSTDFTGGHSRHHAPRIHETVHPYLRKPSYTHHPTNSIYAHGFPASASSSIEVHRSALRSADSYPDSTSHSHSHSSSSSPWVSRVGYASMYAHPAPSSSCTLRSLRTYAPSGPGSDHSPSPRSGYAGSGHGHHGGSSNSSTLMSSTNPPPNTARRWSLPDSTNLGIGGPFLM